MAMTFSHAVGYRGIAKIGSSTLLCTGGNLSYSQDPIMSGGVWGAGYQNAAPIAYAYNYLSLEGSCNFEWTTSTSDWTAIRKFAIYQRAPKPGTETKITLKPDGQNGFDGKAWCSSLSFEASEGAALTGSFNFKGDPSGGGLSSGKTDTTRSEDDLKLGASGGNPGVVGRTLIPYWQTSVYDYNPDGNNASSADDTTHSRYGNIINWSCSYNSDLQVLKCCGYQSTAPEAPDYILCGEMSAECSMTLFLPAGFGGGSFHPTTNGGFIFFIGKTRHITIPYVLCSSTSVSMATGASYITGDYSYTGIGDGKNPIISMSEN